jgi:hypothetical protein
MRALKFDFLVGYRQTDWSSVILITLSVAFFLASQSAGIWALFRYFGTSPFSMIETVTMFARKLHIEFESHGQRHPCPLKWLDSFSMRNFTNATVFDDTLPVADGRMEIGTAVPVDQLREAMEDWFRRKSYLAKDDHLLISEVPPS